VPGNDLDDEDKSWLSSALSNVFYSYDRTGNGYVDATELASGFTLFASGSKSEKLLLAFQAFDKDCDGLLSKRGLWKYLRSFLTVLLSLVEGILDVPMVEVERLVDNGAVQLTETVFTDVNPTEGGQISFEEFAEWYTNGGFEVAPWLELLDLSKWPFGATAAASSAASASNTGAGAPVGQDDAVFEFPLTLDSDDNSNVLSFYESDVDNLHAIVGKTQLHSQPPARLHEVFSAMSTEVRLISKGLFIVLPSCCCILGGQRGTDVI
jgi:Ca2+-binding EF-hand superfamily protein